MTEPPEYVSQEDMQRRFHGGPRLGKGVVLVMIDQHIYKREDGRWRRLDDRSYRSTEEMIAAVKERKI